MEQHRAAVKRSSTPGGVRSSGFWPWSSGVSASVVVRASSVWCWPAGKHPDLRQNLVCSTCIPLYTSIDYSSSIGAVVAAAGDAFDDDRMRLLLRERDSIEPWR